MVLYFGLTIHFIYTNKLRIVQFHWTYTPPLVHNCTVDRAGVSSCSLQVFAFFLRCVDTKKTQAIVTALKCALTSGFKSIPFSVFFSNAAVFICKWKALDQLRHQHRSIRVSLAAYSKSKCCGDLWLKAVWLPGESTILVHSNETGIIRHFFFLCYFNHWALKLARNYIHVPQ